MKDPIFTIGTGRSGTTIFYRMFKDHPNVSWLNQYAQRYPNRMYINRFFLRMLCYPILGKAIQKRLNVGEFYAYWDRVFTGFSLPCRDLFAEDVNPRIKKAFHRAISESLVKSRDQFIAKFTGWPRIGFLQEIFPDAKFIHVMRDGRAVVHSLITWSSWWGWRGPQNWRWGSLPQDFYKVWEKHQKSFIALAAIQWIILEEAFSNAIAKSRKGSVLTVKYEQLCSNPIEVFKQVTDFCELECSHKFVSNLKKHQIFNANEKWRTGLSPKTKNYFTGRFNRVSGKIWL